MRAWVMRDYSGIGGLKLEACPDPVPAENEVVLRVQLAGLNPADRYLAEKQYPAHPTFPHILGRDGIGTVTQTAREVQTVRIGDRRLIMRSLVGVERPGTFAEKVAVPLDSLAEVPTGWTNEEAAGASLVYLTAYQALTMWGPLPAGAVVLITGASGGVGVAATQLSRAMGCRVVCLSRDSQKRSRLAGLGAAITLDPSDSKWRSELKKQLAPGRVHLAVDNVGGKLFPEVIDCLGDRGMVSVVGRLAGPVPSFNTAALFFRRLRIGGVAVGAYTSKETAEAWEDILKLLGPVRPLVDSVFDFEKLPQAFERLAAGPMGKVLLRVN